MITPEEVKKLFLLSRIEAGAIELEQFPRELNSIFGYVEQLKNASVGETLPTLSFVSILPELRKDLPAAQDAVDTEGLKRSFPESKDGFLQTKKVFE